MHRAGLVPSSTTTVTARSARAAVALHLLVLRAACAPTAAPTVANFCASASDGFASACANAGGACYANASSCARAGGGAFEAFMCGNDGSACAIPEQSRHRLGIECRWRPHDRIVDYDQTLVGLTACI